VPDLVSRRGHEKRVVVGRIMKAAALPEGMPWLWLLPKSWRRE
jgi:hypothetical protein